MIITCNKFRIFIICSCLVLNACNGGSPEPQVESNVTTSPESEAAELTATQIPAIPVDSDDIAGMVNSVNGVEAGVWVIAETDEFETRYAKIVVTDDEGRFLIPDLPDASYEVWVRGYGLVDSAKTQTTPGNTLNLLAPLAPDAASAAEIYPAAYWYSMMKVPGAGEVSHLEGGLNEYMAFMKNRACIVCHQLGNRATRVIPEMFADIESTEQAWIRRVSSGQAGDSMLARAARLGVAFKYLSDWTDRIEAGELPHTTPERPAGMERNVVLTIRDWSSPTAYLHDLSGTDRRDPTVNAYGQIYGAPEFSTDEFPILDPVNNTSRTFTAPVRDDDTPSAADDPVNAPSAYWGDEKLWDARANAHNPMLDQDGRVWYTARIRAPENPDFCQAGSSHPSAQLYPTPEARRQLSFYEPDTGEYTFVDTCFDTHHLHFSEDPDNTLWTSGDDFVAGWVKTRIFLETGDIEAAIGWSPFILDTNGNGEVDEWVEPDEPVDQDKDKRIIADTYAVMPNPADGSVWYSSVSSDWRGGIVRFDPATGLSEVYRPPMPGFANRGADIDRNGVVWLSMGSGHLGQFDRRKCQGPLNGPQATGDHCPEGWSFHDLPGPGFVGLEDSSVESSYYTWVDQRGSLGIGENVPMVTGNLHDGIHVFKDGNFMTLRVPYPLGFYTKGFEGRIDDPDADWKGRGLWVPSGDRTPFHYEGGKGSKPLVVHFQMRPDPLAK
jgi:hypothetical protein